MEDLYLGLGSNLGDRERLLRRAVRMLEERIGGHCRLSAFYETEPWGFLSENTFLNAVAVLRSDKESGELLRIKDLLASRASTGDEATRYHYKDLILRIDNALEIK